MPLILDRKQVQAVYAKAAERKWVLPTFNTENLTTSEAILAATLDYSHKIGIDDLPIIIGVTNKYQARPQSIFYSHTRQWDIGMRLFLKELEVLTSAESPFANLNVMIHLDHIQWDIDQELLNWDMNQFSSIMYDASTLSLEENIKKTAIFREQHSNTILIEGACDEIGKPSTGNDDDLTTPEDAERYLRETGVDIIVANLGTEHRASAATLRYRSDLAREISQRIKPCLCLHGTSSVPVDHLTHLFDDGVRKVNIWTALERDSSSILMQDMLKNAAKIVGPEKANNWITENLLGSAADFLSKPSVNFYTTTYRQDIIFKRMKEIVTRYLETFYS